MHERGSVSLVMAAVVAVAGLLAALVATLAGAAAARVRAQSAADGAALAAAQELIRPSGRSPEEVASAYAVRNGARLRSCRCSLGGSDVQVEVSVAFPLAGMDGTARASARAVATRPDGSAGLQPAFAASLSCLFSRVPGLRVISGYRTYEEQARLHRTRPHLAAPPGHSNHERGLAADLGFVSAGVRSHAHALAASCGLAFPVPHEPWHIEPMERGPPTA
jgi:secretion/DNA translocation related TadE-like protein